MPKRISFADPKVIIDGTEIDRKNIASFEVMKDIDQPDFASIVLSNFGDDQTSGGGGSFDFLMEMISGNVSGQRFSVKPKGGADLVVKMKQEGDSEETVFEGQLTGFYPSFDTHLPVTVHVRGMNKMHKLTRERRTRTFQNQTEQQIVSKIIQDNGLQADFGREPPTLLHEHLHQPNMTDLEFLRQRAARTCRECYVEKDTFYFRKRQKDEGPVATLTYTNEGVDGAEGNPEGGGALESFSPEFATSGQVKKVTVHCWDPTGSSREAQMLTGKAEASASPLGQEAGSSAFGDNPELHIFDIPARTREEADLLAKSILEERQMNFITAEAVTLGNAKIKPGCVVELKTQDDRFNGKYYVAGAHFSFAGSMTGLGGGKGMGGYKTHLKLKRDAGQGGGGG
jgi:phage protein D